MCCCRQNDHCLSTLLSQTHCNTALCKFSTNVRISNKGSVDRRVCARRKYPISLWFLSGFGFSGTNMSFRMLLVLILLNKMCAIFFLLRYSCASFPYCLDGCIVLVLDLTFIRFVWIHVIGLSVFKQFSRIVVYWLAVCLLLLRGFLVRTWRLSGASERSLHAVFQKEGQYIVRKY